MFWGAKVLQKWHIYKYFHKIIAICSKKRDASRHPSLVFSFKAAGLIALCVVAYLVAA